MPKPTMKQGTFTIWPHGQYGQRVVVPDVRGRDEREMASHVMTRLRAALNDPCALRVHGTTFEDVRVSQ